MGRRGELKKGALFLRVAASPPLRVRYAAHTLPTAHRTPQYVELHARSAFSFLRGAATPEELIAACSALEMPAMALLDNDGVYGAARFHLAAQKIGIKGAYWERKSRSDKSDIRSSRKQKAEESRNRKQKETDAQTFALPVLVRNRTGYQNLCRLITLMKLRVPKHANLVSVR
jgi:error-prone DNA polymerase